MSNKSGSSTGSIIGGILGGIIAGVASGGTAWQLGVMIGSVVGGLAGGLYDARVAAGNPNRQETIGEFLIQTSSLGVPIVQIIGHGRTAGNVTYLGERYVNEDSATGGGKKQPDTIIKTYEIDAMVTLCDTQLSGPMRGIRRAWADGTLKYHVADDGIGNYPDEWTFYSGALVQVPSPMMEDVKGVGNVPGYPLTCYLTMDNYQMGTYPRFPNWSFELYQNDSAMPALQQLIRRPSSGIIYAACPSTDELILYNGTTQGVSGSIDLSVSDPDPGRPFATLRGLILGFETSDNLLWIADPGKYSMKRMDLTDNNSVQGPYFTPYSLLSGGIYHAGNMWFCAYHYGTKVGYVLRLYPGAVFPDPELVAITTGQARNGQMKMVAVSATSVWVTDNHYPGGGGNSNLVHIDPITNTVTATVSLGTAANSEPIDVVKTSEADLWVLDRKAETVIRINAGTPAVTATIGVGQMPFQLAVASDGFVWACTAHNAGTMYRIDPSDNTKQTLASEPLSQQSPAHPLMAPGASGSMWVLSIQSWTAQRFATDGTSIIVDLKGEPRGIIPEGGTHIWVSTTRGEVLKITDAGEVVNATNTDMPRLKTFLTTLSGVVGLQPADIDLTELPNPNIALTLSSIRPARDILRTLMDAYQFFAINSNLQVKFRTLEPGAIVATILEEELAARGEAQSDDDDAPQDKLPMVLTPDDDLPTELTVVYSSRKRNYQNDTQRAYVSNSRGVSRHKRSVQIDTTLTDAYARRLAQETLDRLWLQRLAYQCTVNRDYAMLEPGDRISVTYNGAIHIMILNEVGYNRPGLVTLKARGDIAGHINVRQGFAGTGAIVERLPMGAHTTANLLNLPALDTADQAPRYHVGYDYAPASWPGARLYRSIDGTAYTLAHTALGSRATSGTVASALPTGTPYVIDMVNMFTVVLHSATKTLTSISDVALLAGGNVALLGQELLQFGMATLIAPQTYTCSRLLRGRQGTEDRIAGHGTNELFILINAAITSLALPLVERNITRPYKSVTIGTNIATVTAQNFAASSPNLKPWAVGSPLAYRQTNDDWDITWLARSRFAGAWVDGQAFGYDPDVQQFRIQFYSASNFLTLRRTRLVALGADPAAWQTATYTAAQQTTDAGGPLATIYIRIAQMGAYGAGQTVNLTFTG